MPTIVFNDVKPLDETSSLLVIESKIIGSKTVVFDTELEVYVRGHQWCWSKTTQRPYTFCNGKRIELHRHLAEMKHRPHAVGNITIMPSEFCDYRMKNMVIRLAP